MVRLSPILLLPLFAIGGAFGATFTVNSTSDAVDAHPGDGICETATGNGVCTLRAAIQETNALAGADTIIVPAGVYTLTIAGAAEDLSATGDLDIRGNLTLTGAGASSTIVQACDATASSTGCTGIDRVFHVDPAGTGISVSISGVTIRNGTTTVIPFVSANGGGVLLGVPQTSGAPVPGGTLTLTDCTISGSSTPRNGGGIANNAGTLKLIRTTLSSNTADTGGGVFNGDLGVVTIADSTISANVAGSGGGLFSGQFDISGATKVTLTNTTINGNVASTGGGIFNNRGPLTLVNVTVSGNTANSNGAAGAGLVASGGPVTVNNSTITLNAGNAGYGGGFTGALTMSNSIVANNSAYIGPDCWATIVSAGYNLVQNAANCTISGTTTGNKTGVSANLGALADNGGATKTHALIAGSPAIDAGNPATPGSGGTSCAGGDQRGFVRPRGAACDMGAFERSPQLAISSVVPSRASNTAPATAFIGGGGFVQGASVVLRRSGQPDIPGVSPAVEAGSADIATYFDITGKSAGAWDVVVTNPDLSTVTLPGGFTIDSQTGSPQVYVDIIGRQVIRPNGGVGRITVLFGNRGNADAIGVPLSLYFPTEFGVSLRFLVQPPAAQPGQVPTTWSDVPIVTTVPTPGFTNVNFYVPLIPAGFAGALQIQITAVTAAEGQSYAFPAVLGIPYFQPALDPTVPGDFVTGAQAYALSALHVSIPASANTAMSQYITNSLNLATQFARTQLVNSFGQTTPIYSIPQLTFDLARYGATQPGTTAVGGN